MVDARKEQNEERGRRGWRDDPLSLFLIVAALILGAMYVVEQVQRDGLDEGQARAATWASHERMAAGSCEVFAAGPAGRDLLVRCPEGVEAVRERVRAVAAAKPADLEGVERFILRGTDGALSCPVDGSGWEDGCVESETPVGPPTPPARQAA